LGRLSLLAAAASEVAFSRHEGGPERSCCLGRESSRPETPTSRKTSPPCAQKGAFISPFFLLIHIALTQACAIIDKNLNTLGKDLNMKLFALPRSLRAVPCRALVLLAGTFIVAQAASAQTPAPKPPPDLIVFANGDQLTGTFERILGDNVVFKSDMAGEITVPLAKVKQLRAGGEFAVLRKDRPVTKQAVIPGTIALEGSDLKLTIPSVPEATIPTKDVAFVIDKGTYVKETNPHPSLFYGWSGAVTGGATLVRASQNGNTFNAGIALARNVPTVSFLPKRNRTLFGLTETYGTLTQPQITIGSVVTTPYSQVKTSIFHTGLEQDQYISNRFYLLGTATFDHNFSQSINFQQIYGVGVGWTVIQNAKQELDLSASIHYERQNFIQPIQPATPPFIPATPGVNLIGATIGENYLRHLPGKLLFTESLGVLPAFNTPNDYSALASAGLVLPVYHRFAVNFNTSDSFLNNPAPGFKKNSYQFVTGVTYTLK
jgi:Protein of unknown function, DUF481